MPVITFSISRPYCADYSINFDYIHSFQYRQVDMQWYMFMHTYTYKFTCIYHCIVLPLNSFSRQGTYSLCTIDIYALLLKKADLNSQLFTSHVIQDTFFYSYTSDFIFKDWDFSNKIFKSRNIYLKSKSDYFLECMNLYRFLNR